MDTLMEHHPGVRGGPSGDPFRTRPVTTLVVPRKPPAAARHSSTAVLRVNFPKSQDRFSGGRSFNSSARSGVGAALPAGLFPVLDRRECQQLSLVKNPAP